MQHNVTIKDIAEKSGFSVSTVSRALHDHPDISPETKAIIRKIAEELQYSPNQVALRLRSKKTFTIGVIIPQIVHHFFSSVISGIEEVASKANYNVLIFQSNESYEREKSNVKAIKQSMVDGVIISMTKNTNSFKHFKELVDSGIPVVFFDRVCPDIQTDSVVIDDFEAAFTTVEHLITTGRRNIIHFAGPQNLEIGKLRKQGYIHALKKYNIEIKEENIILCDKLEQAVDITNELIRKQQIPDAIFAVNDSTAIGALITFRKHGIKIPDDVAIAGFTNGLISAVTEPPLTTVEQNGFMMGQKAAELVLKRITDNTISMKPQKIIIPTKLIIRGSTVKGIN